jgi:hypothetical protein
VNETVIRKTGCRQYQTGPYIQEEGSGCRQVGALGGPGPDRLRFNALHPCTVYFPLLNLKPRKLTSPEKQTGFQVLTEVVMRVLYFGTYRRVVS